MDENRCPLLGAEMCVGEACQFWGPAAEDCLLAMVLERGAKLLGRVLNAQDRERREREKAPAVGKLLEQAQELIRLEG